MYREKKSVFLNNSENEKEMLKNVKYKSCRVLSDTLHNCYITMIYKMFNF